MGVKERIKELEEQLKTTKYNKKTQHAIGLRKAQLAELKRKAESQGKAGGGQGYAIKKSGDATVVMVGFPSVGKSTLINALTNQESEVGGYDFTTLDAIPGLLEYKGAKIQIFDLPGLVEGAAAGTGRGKEVLSVVKNSDLCLIVIDINKPEELGVIKKELYDADIRINEKKPDVKFKKTIKGGITLSKTVPLDIDDDLVKEMLNEMGIVNADVLIRSKVNEDQLIDAVIGNRKYLNAVIILNKCDSVSDNKASNVKKKTGADVLISAKKKENLRQLKELIFEKLNLMRIYLKEPSKDVDLKEPLIIGKGSTIRDVCKKLHREMVDKFKFARVWGSSAKHPGQKLTLKHKLKDEDILEIHLI
jgi:hypothetical protein